MQPLGENSVNVPAFLGKLWKMVNDPNTDQLISWSQSGNSFVIQNQAQFWYELLPLYYKHNNMSSFVRQLNMYGFHKVSTVENGTMDADKDEIQFYHPFFQKDQPELLKNIKRKVTVSKSEGNNQNLLRHDDLAKVLTDVKQLRGRQSSVDSQLTTMKQENAVLWRELALLRQKHLKQQQIVNKLIQFLVTLVQPTASARMGVGVKRRIPLMLHEKKSKIRKTNRSANVDSGPTIHELDAEMEIPIPDSFEEEEPMVNSPLTPTTSSQKAVNSPQSSTSAAVDDASRDMWDKPDYITTELPDMDDILGDNDTDNDNLPVETLNNLQDNTSNCDEKIFLNPTTRDTLLSNLIQGNYNSTALNGKNVGGGGKKSTGKDEANNIFVENTEIQPNNDMTVATRDMRINSGDDLDLHLESTQSELEQLKDILNGCNSFDANALLGLFNDDAPGFGLSLNPKDDSLNETGADPMVSGSELATCGSNLIDFNELFDDSIDAQDSILATAPSQLTTTSTADSSTVNTPLVAKSEPIFPTVNKQQQN